MYYRQGSISEKEYNTMLKKINNEEKVKEIILHVKTSESKLEWSANGIVGENKGEAVFRFTNDTSKVVVRDGCVIVVDAEELGYRLIVPIDNIIYVEIKEV